MREMLKNALKKAIQNFFRYEDLFDEKFIRYAAEDYVFNHDQEIKERLLEDIDLTDEFEEVLNDLPYYEIWQD